MLSHASIQHSKLSVLNGNHYILTGFGWRRNKCRRFCGRRRWRAAVLLTASTSWRGRSHLSLVHEKGRQAKLLALAQDDVLVAFTEPCHVRHVACHVACHLLVVFWNRWFLFWREARNTLMTPDAQPIPGFLFDKRQANLADFPILAEDLELSALFSITFVYFFGLL